MAGHKLRRRGPWILDALPFDLPCVGGLVGCSACLIQYAFQVAKARKCVTLQLEYLSIAGFVFVLMLLFTMVVESCKAGLPAISNGEFSTVGFTDICKSAFPPRKPLMHYLDHMCWIV